MRISDIITEGVQDEYLYHWTSYNGIKNIIADGQINPGKAGFVSLTRDPRYIVTRVNGPGASRITVDKRKLSQTIKVYPHDESYLSKNQFSVKPRGESEERVNGAVLLKYVVSIDLPKYFSPEILRNDLQTAGPEYQDQVNEWYTTSKYIEDKAKSLGIKINWDFEWDEDFSMKSSSTMRVPPR
jgi:hypothetical protein